MIVVGFDSRSAPVCPRARLRATMISAERLRVRDISATEAATSAIEKLQALTPALGAVAALDPERTLRDAEESDRRLSRGEARTLEGVPFAVKDWIDVAGWPVTGGDPAYRDRRAAADATAVARLRAAGAVVVAITRVKA